MNCNLISSCVAILCIFQLEFNYILVMILRLFCLVIYFYMYVHMFEYKT